METEIKFFKLKAVYADLYGIENWILREENKNKIQAAKMTFFEQC